MDFKKRMKIRFYTGIVFGIIGILLILLGFFKKTEESSSFGLMFLVISLARYRQYKRITKDYDTFSARETEETDERNIMIWTKSRSLASSVYVIAAAVAIVVMHFMQNTVLTKALSYNLLGFVLINWICYFVIKSKY